MTTMKRTYSINIPEHENQEIRVKGRIEDKRNLGGLGFLTVRDLKGTFQVISEDKSLLADSKKNSWVDLIGVVKKTEHTTQGYEIELKNIDVLAQPKEPYPISIKPSSSENLNTKFDYRTISIRNPHTLDIFRVQETIAQCFSNYLKNHDFTQIFTSKIVSLAAEGGANLFKLDYFGKSVYLAQSPQLYKQIMVGSGLERVFEIGHVYRAEEHDTPRHMNEYVSLDYEMGFIDSFNDIIDLEEGLIHHILEETHSKHGNIISKYTNEKPSFKKIPRIPLLDMKEILKKNYNKEFEEGKDIDPEGERLATEYVKKNYGTDLVFLTHYPTSARPFYTMPNSENPAVTDSFDLVFRGLEITTGGQRMHNYDMLTSNMKKLGMHIDEKDGYLMVFKYGMPPHGGLAIGLERMTAKILGLNNVKEASLFPRDRKRSSP